MAQFEIPGEKVPVGEICIDLGAGGSGPKKIKMELAGFGSNGKPLEITSEDAGVLEVRPVSSDPKRKASLFEMIPRSAGRTAVDVWNDSDDPGPTLGVTVGTVTNHNGMAVDLFAEYLGRSSEPKKLQVYQSALAWYNNALPDRKDWGRLKQPLKQDTRPGHYDCGTALVRFAWKYFGKSHTSDTYGQAYYEPPKSNKMADLKINAGKMAKAVAKIANLLDNGTAVRVFAVHDDGFTIPVITNTAVTHFLNIIGYGADNKFLYIDPWPGGSNLAYTSGIFGTVHSAFMGMLQYRNDRLENITHGAHRYLVIAGP
jgi:hypothetical protein